MLPVKIVISIKLKGHMTYSRCCLEIIVPDNVSLCSNFGLTLKIPQYFCSIFFLKKKCAPTEILLMLFKIVD